MRKTARLYALTAGVIFVVALLAMACNSMSNVDDTGSPTSPPPPPKVNDLGPSEPESMTDMTALEFFRHHDLRAGWNLGNTLDAVNSFRTRAVETEWGNPRASQALLEGVRAQGFDILRIPVSWIGHIGPAPHYELSEERLRRVTEVVGYARAAGFKTIIINIHHDGNYTEPNRGTWGFLDMAGALNSSRIKEDVQNQLARVWTQIADYFINYGDYLVFETMNEVHGGSWGSNNNRTEQGILFDWHQAALNAIRSTGGNNATRYVAIGGVGSSEPSYVRSSHSRGLLLPDDDDNGTDRLIVKSHYYHPWRFTVAAATGQAGSNLIHTWGTNADRRHPGNEFAQLKSTFIDNGIAVFIGEWGAPTNHRAGLSQEIQATHIDYIGTVAQAARANGIPPVIWDDGGNFRMLQRSNHTDGTQAGNARDGLWENTLNAIIDAVSTD